MRLYRRWCYGNLWVGRMFTGIHTIKKPGSAGRLCTSGDTLFQFPCIFIDKTEQDMVTPHGLASMTDARMFGLHPGIDHPFKGGHAVSTLSAIKAFEPVHILVLSAQQSNCTLCRQHDCFSSTLIGDYCIMLVSNLLDSEFSSVRRVIKTLYQGAINCVATNRLCSRSQQQAGFGCKPEEFFAHGGVLNPVAVIPLAAAQVIAAIEQLRKLDASKPGNSKKRIGFPAWWKIVIGGAFIPHGCHRHDSMSDCKCTIKYASPAAGDEFLAAKGDHLFKHTCC